MGLFGMELHYQMISKLFESPRRLVCKAFGQCEGESYNNQGVSSWHSVALKAYQWLLDQDSFTFHAGFMLAFAVVSLVSVLEFFTSFSFTLPLALAFVVMSRRSTQRKLKTDLASFLTKAFRCDFCCRTEAHVFRNF